MDKDKKLIKIFQKIKPVDGFEGYFAGDNGDIFSSKKGENKKLNATKAKNGYKYVTLCNSNEKKKIAVHKVIINTFKENPNPELYTNINHINRDRLDNRLDNLEYCTPTYNNQHMSILSRENKTFKELYPNSRLNSEEDVLNIYKLAHEGKTLQKDIAKMYNITETTVCEIKRGSSYNNITKHNENGILKLEKIKPDGSIKSYKGEKLGMPKGEQRKNSKLTEKQVLDAKYLLENTEMSNRQIANKLNIPYYMVSKIKNGKAWNYLTGY